MGISREMFTSLLVLNYWTCQWVNTLLNAAGLRWLGHGAGESHPRDRVAKGTDTYKIKVVALSYITSMVHQMQPCAWHILLLSTDTPEPANVEREFQSRYTSSTSNGF